MKTNNYQLLGVLNSPVWLLIILTSGVSPCVGQEADRTSIRPPDLWKAAKRGDPTEIHDALASGAKLNAQDDVHGITPLCWAAMSGHKDAVAALVEAGADVNGRNGDGATPLIAAAFLGRAEVIKMLLEHRARVDVVNGEGEGPLAVMEIHRNTTFHKARALGIDLDLYQLRRGRKGSAEILLANGAVEDTGSPLAFAVLVVIAGIVGGVTWLIYRAKEK